MDGHVFPIKMQGMPVKSIWRLDDVPAEFAVKAGVSGESAW